MTTKVTVTKTEKLAKLFETKKEVTATDINKLGIKNARDGVFRLRKQGYCIYATKTKNKTVYRLGVPTKAMVATLFEAFGSSMYDDEFLMS